MEIKLQKIIVGEVTEKDGKEYVSLEDTDDLSDGLNAIFKKVFIESKKAAKKTLKKFIEKLEDDCDEKMTVKKVIKKIAGVIYKIKDDNEEFGDRSDYHVDIVDVQVNTYIEEKEEKEKSKDKPKQKQMLEIYIAYIPSKK